MRQELVRWRAGLRHPEHVELAGFIEDVPAFWAGCRVAVLPSRAEGFGLAAAEAAACGLPVVATDASSLPEIVVDGTTGLLVPTDDDDALATALTRLLHDPGLAATLGTQGREHVARRFDRRQTLDRLLALTRSREVPSMMLRAAVVQTDPVFGEVARNVEEALALVPAACDLAVLPELFATGYQFVDRAEAFALAETIPDGPTCRRLREFAAATGTTLVAGLAERAGDRVFNSAVLMRPDGTHELYRKVHLFWDEKLVFDPGNLGFPVFTACGTTIGVMICFDWIFPEAARTLALRGAQLICHPSNLVLPHCPNSMPVRALENRVFTLTANRVGREHRTAAPLVFIGQQPHRLPACRGDRHLRRQRRPPPPPLTSTSLCATRTSRHATTCSPTADPRRTGWGEGEGVWSSMVLAKPAELLAPTPSPSPQPFAAGVATAPLATDPHSSARPSCPYGVRQQGSAPPRTIPQALRGPSERGCRPLLPHTPCKRPRTRRRPVCVTRRR